MHVNNNYNTCFYTGNIHIFFQILVMIRTVKGELDEIDSFIDWKMTVDNNLLEYIKNKTILMLFSQGFLPLFNSESKRL